jgi:hypothetical protein
MKYPGKGFKAQGVRLKAQGKNKLVSPYALHFEP